MILLLTICVKCEISEWHLIPWNYIKNSSIRISGNTAYFLTCSGAKIEFAEFQSNQAPQLPYHQSPSFPILTKYYCKSYAILLFYTKKKRYSGCKINLHKRYDLGFTITPRDIIEHEKKEILLRRLWWTTILRFLLCSSDFFIQLPWRKFDSEVGLFLRFERSVLPTLINFFESKNNILKELRTVLVRYLVIDFFSHEIKLATL